MKKLFLVICISVLTAFVSVSSAANGWINILKEGGNNKGVLQK